MGCIAPDGRTGTVRVGRATAQRAAGTDGTPRPIGLGRTALHVGYSRTGRAGTGRTAMVGTTSAAAG
jgi:hypothetical protein